MYSVLLFFYQYIIYIDLYVPGIVVLYQYIIYIDLYVQGIVVLYQYIIYIDLYTDKEQQYPVHIGQCI
jgi:hypothetical protein